MFRDRAFFIENLKWYYILGQVLHRTNRFGMGYSTTGRHYITINGEMKAQAISQTTNSPILKTKGKIMLPPMSISIVGIKMPTLQNTNNVYELNFETFQLLKGVITLNVLHRIDHKTPQSLSVSILNANNSFCSILKNSPIAMLALTGKCEGVQKVSWSRLQCDTAKLLPKIPPNTNLQLEPNTNPLSRSIPDADIPQEAKNRIQELLDKKYIHIMSQTATDVGRTNLIELDIPMEGPPIALKPYTIPLKYYEFMDHKIKQLEEVGIISQSMSNWASPALVVPKKEECVDTSNNPGSSKNGKSNLQMCIYYRKLSPRIQTACQIKANCSLGKIISNYPLPTIDSILVGFNGCKFFSTIDLSCGYYHIQLTKEAAEKTVFITNKGKWIFHSLPFRINIGSSAFSCVLGKVLTQCTKFTLNYLDDIMIFSETWQEHLGHLNKVFK